jgi:hypothetical protein
MANQEGNTVNELQARTIHKAYDSYVKSIHRQTKAQLADAYRGELADRGQILAYGGPASKDELISALIELRYPRAMMNETIHVLYHQDFISSVCAYCNPDPCPVCGAIDACTFTGNESGAIVNGRHVNV